jgi:hypothetical protein
VQPQPAPQVQNPAPTSAAPAAGTIELAQAQPSPAIPQASAPPASTPAPTSGPVPADGDLASIASAVEDLSKREATAPAPDAPASRPEPRPAPPPAAKAPAKKPEPAKAETPPAKKKPELAKAETAAAKKKPDPKKAPEPKKPDPAKAEPSRHWVQVAGGADKGSLPREFARLRTKAPKLLGSRTAWTTPLRATNRLLVGPFKSEKEAQDFVNELAKSDLSAFAWTSEPGQKIEKLPAK